MFKEYLKYLKDNPQGYWFKAKCYGWGWTPARWQGWLITLIYIVFIVLLSLTVDENSIGEDVALDIALPFVFLTATFIFIAYKKGEKPRWRWGKDK